MAIRFFTQGLEQLEQKATRQQLQRKVSAAHQILTDRLAPYGDFLGWLDAPLRMNSQQLSVIETEAKRLQKLGKQLVVVGVGGSSLGTRAGLCWCFGSEQVSTNGVELLFAGTDCDPVSLEQLKDHLAEGDFCVNVISKSGATLEPAIAFRFLEQWLVERYGVDGARERIVVTTDAQAGPLRTYCDQMGFHSFAVPMDMGGRYSVLSPVGLLPLAVAGVDIFAVMQGAAWAREAFNRESLEENDCYRYAAARHLLYEQGKRIEMLCGYDSRLNEFGAWFRQLFAESHGKAGKGVFPAYSHFTSELHSIGQYIQQGEALLFETVLLSAHREGHLRIPSRADDFERLNRAAGRTLAELNDLASKATIKAHVEGGVPNLLVTMDAMDAYHFGAACYFFEKACALGGLMLGIHPFDQPGVEFYKRNMEQLLSEKENGI